MFNPFRAARDRARSVRGAMRAAMIRGFKRAQRTWNDPPVDLLIAGVFGSSVGRMYLYISSLISLIVGSMWALCCIVLCIAVFDLTVHSLTCKSLIDWLRTQYTGEIQIGKLTAAPSITGKGGETWVQTDVIDERPQTPPKTSRKERKAAKKGEQNGTRPIFTEEDLPPMMTPTRDNGSNTKAKKRPPKAPPLFA